jgi:hypothetical protein
MVPSRPGGLPNSRINDLWVSDKWAPACEATTRRSMKLLYNPCGPVGGGNAAATDSWAHDDSVHVAVFPRAICHELLGILEASALWQPPRMRTMRGFRVGYLPLDGV